MAPRTGAVLRPECRVAPAEHGLHGPRSLASQTEPWPLTGPRFHHQGAHHNPAQVLSLCERPHD